MPDVPSGPGSLSVTEVPRPSLLTMAIEPPCKSAMDFTNAKPRPVLCCARISPNRTGRTPGECSARFRQYLLPRFLLLQDSWPKKW